MPPVSDVRYPVGRFDFHAAFDSSDWPLWLEQLRDAPVKLRAAVSGLNDPQLDTPYREGGWTLRQVVHHLADAHMNWYVRTKLALTEAEPTIKPYDEQLWAALPEARTAPVELSLAIFDGVHARWVQLFKSLQPEDWSRRFHHPEQGTLKVEDILRAMAWHSRHHTGHITGLRARMGW